MFTHFLFHLKAMPLLKVILAAIATCALLIHATVSSEQPYDHDIQAPVQTKQNQDLSNSSSTPTTPSHLPNHKDDLWAIAYTPYTTTGACKLAPEIQADVTRIAAAGFSAIRLYSTDCHILTLVAPTLRTHSLTLLLGIHLTSCTSTSSSTTEQLTDILTFAQWPLIALLVLGNEAIFTGVCSAPEVATLLDSTTSQLRAAGYTGPITTSEPLSVVYEHADLLCPRIDVLASNIQPYFHPRVAAAQAGRFVAFQVAQLARACGDGVVKDVVNLETGWPSAGVANGEAEAGIVEQRRAIDEVRAVAGNRSVFASFEDEVWREGGEWGVEDHWGCMGVFET